MLIDGAPLYRGRAHDEDEALQLPPVYLPQSQSEGRVCQLAHGQECPVSKVAKKGIIATISFMAQGVQRLDLGQGDTHPVLLDFQQRHRPSAWRKNVLFQIDADVKAS